MSFPSCGNIEKKTSFLLSQNTSLIDMSQSTITKRRLYEATTIAVFMPVHCSGCFVYYRTPQLLAKQERGFMSHPMETMRLPVPTPLMLMPPSSVQEMPSAKYGRLTTPSCQKEV